MRIISGSLAGRALHTPKGEETRPAMARTREAIFSMLKARGTAWPETRVLDLFAGTGSLAFEALSAGASSAVLVDNSDGIAKALSRTIADLGLNSSCQVVRQDVLRFLRRPIGQKFELVFVDPPYRRDFASPTLAALVTGSWLNPDAFIVAELEKGADITVPENLILTADRLYGQTRVAIWQTR